MYSQQFNKVKNLNEKYNKNLSYNHFCYIIGIQNNINLADLNMSNDMSLRVNII